MAFVSSVFVYRAHAGMSAHAEPKTAAGNVPKNMADEQWWLFTRSEGETPKIVTARFVEESERTPRPVAVTARLTYRAQPNGLPEKGELDRVARLEDKIIEALAPSGALHVGHITCDAVLKVVLYSKEKPAASVTVKTGLLAKTSIELDSRLDNEWSVYELELAPTPVEQEESYNRQLLATLAGHGDVASEPRPVDFAARFPAEASRQAFMDEMAGHGFRPSAEPTWGA
jgi:hypothetical protein